MSQSRQKQTRIQRFLVQNPLCYFCGGANASKTVDHVPPRACFPDGYAPEGFQYRRETGNIMTPQHRFFSAVYQPRNDSNRDLHSLLTSLHPGVVEGIRPNIKPYGDRFRYIFGVKAQEDFFIYVAQFGHGLVC